MGLSRPRKSCLMWSFMSCVVVQMHTGNVAILTCEFLDILWLRRFLNVESPQCYKIIPLFRRSGCSWSWSSNNSVETVSIGRVLNSEKDEDVPSSLSPVFSFWLPTFLTSTSSLIRRGSNMFRVSMILVRAGFLLRFVFPLLPHDLSTWTQHSLDLGWLFSTPLFSCITMVNASLRESLSCSVQ